MVSSTLVELWIAVEQFPWAKCIKSTPYFLELTVLVWVPFSQSYKTIWSSSEQLKSKLKVKNEQKTATSMIFRKNMISRLLFWCLPDKLLSSWWKIYRIYFVLVLSENFRYLETSYYAVGQLHFSLGLVFSCQWTDFLDVRTVFNWYRGTNLKIPRKMIEISFIVDT